MLGILSSPNHMNAYQNARPTNSNQKRLQHTFSPRLPILPPSIKYALPLPFADFTLQPLPRPLTLTLPPLPLGILLRPLNNPLLILDAVQITLIALLALLARSFAEMLTKMMIPLLSQTLTTNIAHAIPTQTDEFVAALALDKAEIALWTGAFDGVGGGTLERQAQRGQR